LTKQKGLLASKNKERLGLVHVDICSLVKGAVSINGHRFWIEIVNSFSSYYWVEALKSRDEAP